MYAPGGYTLENHWNDQQSIFLIQNSDADLVILQEQSSRPVTEPEMFYQYATMLDSVISENGADTGFFMTWAYEENPPMIDGLALAYETIAGELDAMVAPVGRAFEAALTAEPGVELYSSDGHHPSTRGTYLAGCVFYAMIMHRTPVGIEYVNDPDISPFEKRFLQTIAWEVAMSYL